MNRIDDITAIILLSLAVIVLLIMGTAEWDKEKHKPINVIVVGDSNVCGGAFKTKLIKSTPDLNNSGLFSFYGEVGSKIQDIYVPKNNVGYIFITTGINDNPNKNNKQLIRLELLNMINNICINNPKSTVIYVLQHKPSNKYFDQWTTLFDICNEILTDFKYNDIVLPPNFKFNYGLGILTQYEESKILEADGLHLNGKGQIRFARHILESINRDIK